jgi:hypothetical protein
LRAPFQGRNSVKRHFEKFYTFPTMIYYNSFDPLDLRRVVIVGFFYALRKSRRKEVI